MSNEHDHNISKLVAEVVGWRFEFAHTISNDGGNVVIKYYRVYKPDGEQVTYSDFADEEWPEYHLDHSYPDYNTDANAALMLTVEGYELVLHQRLRANRGQWFSQYINDNTINAYTGWGATPAEAICRARLALAEYLEVNRE